MLYANRLSRYDAAFAAKRPHGGTAAAGGDFGSGKLVYGARLGIRFPAGDHGRYQLCPIFTRRWRNRTRIESTLRVT